MSAWLVDHPSLAMILYHIFVAFVILLLGYLLGARFGLYVLIGYGIHAVLSQVTA